MSTPFVTICRGHAHTLELLQEMKSVSRKNKEEEECLVTTAV